jgi:hypothetical protein
MNIFAFTFAGNESQVADFTELLLRKRRPNQGQEKQQAADLHEELPVDLSCSLNVHRIHINKVDAFVPIHKLEFRPIIGVIVNKQNRLSDDGRNGRLLLFGQSMKEFRRHFYQNDSGSGFRFFRHYAFHSVILNTYRRLIVECRHVLG